MFNLQFLQKVVEKILQGGGRNPLPSKLDRVNIYVTNIQSNIIYTGQIYLYKAFNLLFQLWTTQKFSGFIKKIVNFQNLMEIEFCLRLILESLIIHKPFLGSCEAPQKNWTGSVYPCRRLLDSKKKTDRQAKYVNLY